ncbi:MAG: aromatic ring-hydroxylating dioxygenase subunit alpha [Hyphomonadaceae bacterium]|nr:aromatic ring-hydroxylating dioxygenase subunit alpha [Hyphomonadaceae bacterium]
MTYVRNCWYVACWSADITEKPFAAHILSERIVLYRAPSGALVALEDRCVHRNAPLSVGRCEGANIRCLYHGLLFDADGRCIEIPGQDLIPEKARIRKYPVADKHDWIWVWMGDPAKAEENLIPPVAGLQHPEWLLGHGHIDIAGEARLMCDNLLDFTHLSYVHAAGFAASDAWARSRPKFTQLPNGVRSERWVVGDKGMRTREDAAPIDGWQSYDLLLPGILIMWNGFYEAGTAAKMNMGAPDPALTSFDVSLTCQAITPLKEKQTRYFWTWGPRKGPADEAVLAALMSIADEAFGEDRAIVEAQQRVLDDRPDAPIMPTNSDQGVLMYNRFVAELVRDEQSGSASPIRATA